MAGMRVVVVACDDHGNVDLDDLKAKAVEHSDRLASLMVTYPSTHGVYEEQIREICAVVHEHGGQVYLDGANLNALVGVAQPGEFGADVSHLNLHKTFCIPHGGGGPGVGPIGVKAHLAPFLPNHPLRPEAGPATGVGPISAAPWGSAGILPIPWAYITMMGASGLTARDARSRSSPRTTSRSSSRRTIRCSTRARTGSSRTSASSTCGRSPRRPASRVDDVAKRLMDYGFHAPTMSFPVAGTLMIEPTESEDLGELDRFVDAMVAIRGEIARVGRGEWPADDNPLVHAPHTADDVATDDWNARVLARHRGVPGRAPAPRQVLAARSAASTASTATATSCARARRSRPTRSACEWPVANRGTFRLLAERHGGPAVGMVTAGPAGS